MNYEHTIIHVFEPGIPDEVQIEFNYDLETGEVGIVSMKGRLFILHGVSLTNIIEAAILQNEFVGALDGEKYTDHIYFDIEDYAQIKGLKDTYFKDNLKYEPKKRLLNR